MEVDQSLSESGGASHTSDPIPSFALAWSAVRPSSLPAEYDKRIPPSSIFYLPDEDLYVVADRCTKCAGALQACDRALPRCSRCARTGADCVPNSKRFVKLPGPKRERPKSRKIAKNAGSGIRSYKANPTKRLARRTTSQAKAKSPEVGTDRSHKRLTIRIPPLPHAHAEREKTEALSSSHGMAVGPVVAPPSSLAPITRRQGRRKPSTAEYYIPDPETPMWKYVTPPNKRRDDFPPSKPTPPRPRIWAESWEDLLAALPTHPSIVAQHGVGYYGELPEVLILEDSRWDEDKWEELGTIKLTRKWCFRWPEPKMIMTPATSSHQRRDSPSPRARESEAENESPNQNCIASTEVLSESGNVGSADIPSTHESSSATSEAYVPSNLKNYLLPQIVRTCGHSYQIQTCVTCSNPRLSPDTPELLSREHRVALDAFHTVLSSVTLHSPAESQHNRHYGPHSQGITACPHGMSIELCVQCSRMIPRDVPTLLNREHRRNLDNFHIALSSTNMYSSTESRDHGHNLLQRSSGLPSRDTSAFQSVENNYPAQNSWTSSCGTGSLQRICGENSLGMPPSSPPPYSPSSHLDETMSISTFSTDCQIDSLPVTNANGPNEISRYPERSPFEAELFKNTYETGDPIRVIASRCCPLLPFPFPEYCAYAFLGFFNVIDVQTFLTSDDSKNSSGTYVISLTLKWAGDQSGGSDQISRPWWRPFFCNTPYFAENPTDIDEQNDIEIMDLQFLEGVLSYSQPCSTDTFSIPPAWHCDECGKLNVVVPFRAQWSWTCSKCKMRARELNVPTIDPETVRNPSPALPMPIDDDRHAVRVRSIKSAGQQMIMHEIEDPHIVLQHVLPLDPDLVNASKLFVMFQKGVDFQPANSASRKMSYLTYSVMSDKEPFYVPNLIKQSWNWIEHIIQNQPDVTTEHRDCDREVKGMEYIAFIKKSVCKDQRTDRGHILFSSLGASLSITLTTSEDPKGTVEIQMEHGDRVFIMSPNHSLNYVVRSGGPSLLLVAPWGARNSMPGSMGGPEDVLFQDQKLISG